MSFERIDTIKPEFESEDIYEPHMPGVDVMDDIDGFFEMARHHGSVEGQKQILQDQDMMKYVHPDNALEEPPEGQRYVVMVTPGRAIIQIHAPKPGSTTEKNLKPIRDILQTDKSLKITAISYTRLDAYMEDETKTKCIPFLGFLAAFAYLEHDVLLFEGHSTALEASVKGSDFVLLDSGMLPYMQENWAEVIFSAINPGGRVRIHDREAYQLKCIVQQDNPPGWRKTEPDNLGSYANMLLTTLSKSGDKDRTIVIKSNQPIPNLLDLNTNPDEAEYLSTLPYRYEYYDADELIDLLISFSKSSKGFSQSFRERLSATWKLTAIMVLSKGRKQDVTLQFKLASKVKGNRQLAIKLISC